MVATSVGEYILEQVSLSSSQSSAADVVRICAECIVDREIFIGKRIFASCLGGKN